MFLTAVSLAVAAIPEALPAVVTISLAFGARGMSVRKALVRRLPAVETLGSVTFICSDKTGTLTENRMRAERIFVDGEIYEEFPTRWRERDNWLWLARAMALSNDVALGEHDLAIGDPTELALYEAAKVAGLDKHDIEHEWPRVAEITFDSARKRMSTLHRSDDFCVIFTKGAPESILPVCTRVMVGDDLQAISEGPWLTTAEALAEEGYRVLAIACRPTDTVPEMLASETVESDLVLLGLVALIDPPREEAYQAVQDCLGAGITPVMITGDHPGTARAIAQRLGIATDEHAVITGPDLSAMSDEEFAERVEGVRIYARVDPQQKIRIVKALQGRSQFAAMTGDGVNDAPALKRADIGVAMGLKGTDVAREAADMVLLDDNFATIVSAVREGRRIFDNIRKFIKDTMSSNSGEIWTLLLAPLFGLPIPLLPIHILWINLVTDGLPGLAFTAEPAEREIMRRPPRAPSESIFAHGMWQHMVWYGLFVGGVSIASQAWAIDRGVEYWQTVVFTVLTVSQLFHSLAVRSETESLFSIGLTSNWFMLFAVLLTVALQLMVIYVPALNPIFRTQPLPLYDLVVCLVLSSLTLVAVEVEKGLVRAGWIYRSPPGIG
jgi:Ca2+-transporting ATPase